MLPRAVRRADFESERVFADDSVFDDDAEIVVRIFQYFDPFERIALDYQKIGQRTLFDNAEIAGIRVACAGKRQQTGVVAGNHSENFKIGEPLLQLDDPVILIFRRPLLPTTTNLLLPYAISAQLYVAEESTL